MNMTAQPTRPIAISDAAQALQMIGEMESEIKAYREILAKIASGALSSGESQAMAMMIVGKYRRIA